MCACGLSDKVCYLLFRGGTRVGVGEVGAYCRIREKCHGSKLPACRFERGRKKGFGDVDDLSQYLSARYVLIEEVLSSCGLRTDTGKISGKSG